MHQQHWQNSHESWLCPTELLIEPPHPHGTLYYRWLKFSWCYITHCYTPYGYRVIIVYFNHVSSKIQRPYYQQWIQYPRIYRHVHARMLYTGSGLVLLEKLPCS